MEPKSVKIRIGTDTPPKDMEWDKDRKEYVYKEGGKVVVSVTPPKADGTVQMRWGTSTYKPPCSPGEEPICSITDDSKPGRSVQITFSRFAPSAPAIPGSRGGGAPAAPPPAPAAAPPAAIPPGSADTLGMDDRRRKVTEWATRETKIPRDDAINMIRSILNVVEKNCGRRRISERDLRAYYDGCIEGRRRQLAATPAKKGVALGRPRDIDLGSPKGATPGAKPDKPPKAAPMPAALKGVIKRGGTVAQDFDRAVKDYESNSEKFSLVQLRKISRDFSDFEEKSWKLLQALKKSRHPDAADMAKALQERRDVYNGWAYKAYLLMDRHVRRLAENLAKEKAALGSGDAAERAGAKRAFDAHLAAARAELQKTIQCLIDIGMGPVKGKPAPRLEAMKAHLDRLDELKKDATHAIQEASEAELKAAQEASADRKRLASQSRILATAEKTMDRIDAISKMPVKERDKVPARELVALYDVFEAFESAHEDLLAITAPSAAAQALIARFNAMKPRAVAARTSLEKITEQMADYHMVMLQSYAEAMKTAFERLDIRGFRTPRVNFITRYGKAVAFLKGVSKISPQPDRLRAIEDLRKEVITLNPASIRGDEKDLRSRLNAIGTALKKSPDILHPHVRALLAVEEKLEKVRSGLTPAVAQQFDETIKGLRQTIARQQFTILEKKVYAHQPVQVSRFTHKINFEWLTTDKTRVEKRRLALLSLRALEGLFGPTSATQARDVVWDDRLLMTPGAKMVDLKAQWENAKAVLRLIDDYERSGKPPALDGAAPPAPDEIKRRDAAAAADKAYRPIEARMKAAVAAADKHYEQLFDMTKKGVAKTQGPPYMEDLQKLPAELDRIEKELDAASIDATTYDTLEKDRQREADKLKLQVTEAYQKILSLRNRIAAIVAARDPRFMSNDALGREVGDLSAKVGAAALSDLFVMRSRIKQMARAAADRFMATDDRRASALLDKIKPVIDAMDARIRSLGGTPPRAERPDEAAPPAAPEPPSTVEPLAADMKTPAAELMRELGDQRMLLAGVGDDKSRLGDLQTQRRRIAQILAATERRKTEKGMSGVGWQARRLMERIDEKIVALGGTPPPAATQKPAPPKADAAPAPAPPRAAEEPAPAEAPAPLPSLAEARKELADAEAAFKKLNTKLATQSMAELIALRQKVYDLTLNSAWSDEELKGKGADYRRQSDLSRAFNKKVGTLDKLIQFEIAARLGKREAHLRGIQARAEAAVKAADARALEAAKADAQREIEAGLKDLDLLGKCDWLVEDIEARRTSIRRISIALRGLAVDKGAQDSREAAVLHKEIDAQAGKIREIEGSLAKVRDVSGLDRLEAEIGPAVTRLKEIAADSRVAARAQGVLARFEAAQKKIVQLRGALKTAGEFEKISNRVAALLKEVDPLKDTSLATDVLKANQERLVAIKKELEAIDKTVPETDLTRSLKNRISDGIIAITGYVAGIEDALFARKEAERTSRPEAPGRVEAGKATDPVASLRDKVDAFRKETAALRGGRGLEAQKKNLQRLGAIKAALEGIRDTELPKAKGNEIDLRYLREAVDYALGDVERAIKDVQFDLSQNTPQGRLSQLKSRLMNERLHARVSTSDDGNEIIFTGVEADDLRSQAEALGNHIPEIYGRFPKAMLIVVGDPDTTHAAESVKRAFGGRITSLNIMVVRDPGRKGSAVDVTLFFDGKSMAGRAKALQADIKAGLTKKKSADDAAEAERLKPLKDLTAIAKSRGGKAVASDKPLLGKYPVYAARIRVRNADEAVRFIRLVAQTLDKAERDDFVVFAHPAIAEGLADGPSSMQIRMQGGGKPGSRIFTLKPSKPGEVYVVLPARGKGIGMARTFDDHWDALWPTLQQLGFPGRPELSEPKVKERPKNREPAGIAPRILDDRKIVPPASPADAPAATDQPIQLPVVHKTPQVSAPAMKSRFGLRDTQAAIYRGEVDEASLNKPAKLQQRIANIMAHAKSLGMDHVLIIYRGISSKTAGAHYAAFEAIVRNVDPEFKYLRLRNINGSSPGDGEGDIVHYVLIRDTSVMDDSIVRKHEAALREDMKAP